MAIIADPTAEQTEEKVTTVIAEDVHIKGSLGFETSLMIKARLEGDIIWGGAAGGRSHGKSQRRDCHQETYFLR
jgi:cytoskeletal protein CcmA (bactofilin family)